MAELPSELKADFIKALKITRENEADAAKNPDKIPYYKYLEMLEANPELATAALDDKGRTALSFVSNDGQMNNVLKAYGADAVAVRAALRREDNDGNTPILYAHDKAMVNAFYTKLMDTSAEKKEDTGKRLAEANALLIGKKGRNILHAVVEGGNVGYVRELHGNLTGAYNQFTDAQRLAMLNSPDVANGGQTPLMVASSKEMIGALVELGADPATKNTAGKSAVELLKEKLPDVDVQAVVDEAAGKRARALEQKRIDDLKKNASVDPAMDPSAALAGLNLPSKPVGGKQRSFGTAV